MKTQGVVIGAGIGGLTAALALHQRGIRADVYERAAEIREVGAGLVLAPNALFVFDRITGARITPVVCDAASGQPVDARRLRPARASIAA